MLFDFNEQATQDLDERFHGDSTDTVGAGPACCGDTLLQELIHTKVAFLLVVFIGGRRQTFNHIPDKGVDLVLFRNKTHRVQLGLAPTR